MKTIKLFFLMAVLCLGTLVKAQTSAPAQSVAPKWVVEATTVKKERAVKDINLSEADATKFYDLCIQNSMESIERMKTATTEEEKKAVRFEESKILKQNIIATFPGQLGAQLAAWNSEYWGKYLKK